MLTCISTADHAGYLVYTDRAPKKHTVHNLDCCRFIEFVIGAVNELSPGYSERMDHGCEARKFPLRPKMAKQHVVNFVGVRASLWSE